ncbi:MAG: EF-P lysine aminoacylase EpmA [Pirellulaceae bacterium]
MSDADDRRAVAERTFPPTASRRALELRANLLRSLREFFHERGFLEVETPLLSAESVVDRYLDPLPVALDAGTRGDDLPDLMWLQTSPEAAMKRLLASGMEAIYQVTRSFRGGERGRLHNPEFTIVEWYRAGDDMRAGMRLLSDLCEALLGRGAARPVAYREAFRQHLGLDPFQSELVDLRLRVEELGGTSPTPGGADERDELLNTLLALGVEPHLGTPSPTLLIDYPASQAALAKVRGDTPPVAERFELYVDGVELANGYHELLDAEVLARRQTLANQQRAADGKPVLPACGRLLAAIRHGLPACTGVALGFDRVVMLAAGAAHISEVLAFPIDRA